MKFLFFGAHPDDVEMGCAGTILRLKKAGHWVGIVDLTKGEMGTRGTVGSRLKESQVASQLMNIDYRTNLNIGDAQIVNSLENRTLVVEQIRIHQPDYIFINAPNDRHLDHGYACTLVKDSCFLSGLAKYQNPNNLDAYRPKNIFSYVQDEYIAPNFVIDITNYIESKMEVVHSYKTQFFQGKNEGPSTPISSPEFLEFFQGRAAQMGRLIQKRFGEGFIAHQPLGMEEMGWF